MDGKGCSSDWAGGVGIGTLSVRPGVPPSAHAPRSRCVHGQDTVLRPHGRRAGRSPRLCCPPRAPGRCSGQEPQATAARRGTRDPRGAGLWGACPLYGLLAGREQSSTGLPSTQSGAAGLGVSPHPIGLPAGSIQAEPLVAHPSPAWPWAAGEAWAAAVSVRWSWTSVSTHLPAAESLGPALPRGPRLCALAPPSPGSGACFASE